MNWLLFIAALFFSMVLEMSVFDLLDINGMRPSLVAILALFVALWAPKLFALWACLLCGVVIDLTSPLAYDGGDVAYLIGPNALGFAFAGALALQIRSIVMRRQVFALAVMSVIFVVAYSVVVIAVYEARSWYSPELYAFSAAGRLVQALAMAVYTGLLAIPVGWVLLKSFSYWHFPQAAPARTNWR